MDIADLSANYDKKHNSTTECQYEPCHRRVFIIHIVYLLLLFLHIAMQKKETFTRADPGILDSGSNPTCPPLPLPFKRGSGGLPTRIFEILLSCM